MSVSVSSSQMESSGLAPQSPRVRSIRQAMYKKSPVRSPLRQMIKSRCQERMKADRDRIVSGVRKIHIEEGEGRSFMEDTIKMFVEDEVRALRGGRRRLGFGYSEEDIDGAMQELEDIEVEILEDLYGVDLNYEGVMAGLERQVVCPLCQADRLLEGPGVIKCRAIHCPLVVVCVGGLRELQAALDNVVESHANHCSRPLEFSTGDNCLLAICSYCDFCHSIGGF